MARKKISEFCAKKLLSTAVDTLYEGIPFDTSSDSSQLFERLNSSQSFVVKVDQGIKKRMKQGLLALNKKPDELEHEIKKLQKKGYTQFIIEPFLPHNSSSEKYLSLQQMRDGIQVLYSEKGGIDIEENQKSLKQFLLNEDDDCKKFVQAIGQDELFLQFLIKCKKVFGNYYFSFLEINPLVIEKGKISFLDVAAEVDSAGEFFVNQAWSEKDFRSGIIKDHTEAEKTVTQLAAKSQAAFSLQVLNPHGSIFMLLSGGGASIVLADEVSNLGYGKDLANYGEYSGNPNAEETYIYTKAVVQLLLASQAKKKVLIIAGGVANFTDIRITFKGLIQALEEDKGVLQKQQVKVFVRRGGPFQNEGLAMMKAFLENNDLLGSVDGPEILLTAVVSSALESL